MRYFFYICLTFIPCIFAIINHLIGYICELFVAVIQKKMGYKVTPFFCETLAKDMPRVHAAIEKLK